MNVKVGIILSTVLSLSACQSTSYTNGNVAQSNEVVRQTQSNNFVYRPEGKEQFVFAEVPESLQKYMYTDVCLDLPKSHPISECGLDKLNYNSYVGKKGYFVDTPPKEYRGGYFLKEAVLETGETVYLMSSSKFKHIGNKFISLDKHNQISSFEPKPIVKGSEVMITGYSMLSRDRLNVSSQKTHSFTQDEISAIQRIAAKHPKNGARIADLMTTLKVDYDGFEGRTVITNLPFNNRDSYLNLRIVVMDSGKYSSSVEAFYKNKDWLFIDSYSTSADGYRWDSGYLDFKRDHTGGTIWEWNNSPLNKGNIEMLEKMASSKNSIIRFRGKDYYDDYKLTNVQKQELSSLLEIARLMK